MDADELKRFWDDAVAVWMGGGSAVPPELARVFASYRATGAATRPDPDAMPEPWIGDLPHNPGVVRFALNPGEVSQQFQAREGRYPGEIHDRFGGSWSAWASSAPYLRSDWQRHMGPNKFWLETRKVIRAWTGEHVADSRLVSVELYPWHSKGFDASKLSIDDGYVREFILEPLQSVGVRLALAGGKSYWALLERLVRRHRWAEVARVNVPGGVPFQGSCDHRRWLLAESPTGLRVAAMRLDSMPTFPNVEELRSLRDLFGSL